MKLVRYTSQLINQEISFIMLLLQIELLPYYQALLNYRTFLSQKNLFMTMILKLLRLIQAEMGQLAMLVIIQRLQ